MARKLLRPTNSPNWSMKMISWNYRETAKQNFQASVMDLKRLHSPSIMLIVETKIGGDQAKAKATSLGFPKFHIVDFDGLAGGLWLLWNDYKVLIDVVATSSQAIHAIVKVTNQPLLSSNTWFLSSIYGRPTFEIHTEL
ncbi:hypothetical protein SLA2020_032260 [Shorea laevis]